MVLVNTHSGLVSDEIVEGAEIIHLDIAREISPFSNIKALLSLITVVNDGWVIEPVYWAVTFTPTVATRKACKKPGLITKGKILRKQAYSSHSAGIVCY